MNRGDGGNVRIAEDDRHAIGVQGEKRRPAIRCDQRIRPRDGIVSRGPGVNHPGIGPVDLMSAHQRFPVESQGAGPQAAHFQGVLAVAWG